MRVDRLMALLRSDDRVVGYVVVECLNASCSLYTSIKDVHYDDIVLMIDDRAFIIDREDLCEGYVLKGVDCVPSLIRCALIDSTTHSIVAYGCNRTDGESIDMLTCYDAHNVENKDTYNGVSDEIGALDVTHIETEDTAPHDAVDEHDDSAISSDDILLTPKDEVDASTPFYDAIKGELEDLFRRYEHEKALEDSIRDSRFVRIYYEDDRYYVVGDIREDGERASLICYGYPSRKGDVPSEVAGDSTEWLPLDRDDPDGAGYYMMYQNAITGDIIRN